VSELTGTGKQVIEGAERPYRKRPIIMMRTDIDVPLATRRTTSPGSAEGLQESTAFVTPNTETNLYMAAHDDQVFYSADILATFIAGGRITFSVSWDKNPDKAKEWEKSLNKFGKKFSASRWEQEVMLNKLLFGNYFGHIITDEDDVDVELWDPWQLDVQVLDPNGVIPKKNETGKLVGYYCSEDEDSTSSGDDTGNGNGTEATPWGPDVIIHSYWRRLGTDLLGFGLAQQVSDLVAREDTLWELLYQLLLRAAHGLLHGQVKLWEMHKDGYIDMDSDDGVTDAEERIAKLDELLAGRVNVTTSAGRTTIASIANNIITDDSVDLTPVTLNNQISELVKAIELTQNRKTRALRVPKFTTEGEGANRSTSETQATLLSPFILFEQMVLDDDLWHNGLLPILRQNLKIHEDAEIEVVHDPFLPDDRKALADTIVVLVDAGIIDPATEAREMWGLPPLEQPQGPDPFAGQPPAKGPGGHAPDATGPHGAGEGPGEGKGDGTGLEATG